MAVIKISDNTTNGHVIMALFPRAIIEPTGINNFIRVRLHEKEGQENLLDFNLEWWNAPYKESKDGSNND